MTTHQPEPKVTSQHKTVNGKAFKSCPACTARAGEPVFYPIEEFGERQIAPGEHIPQSWCATCRTAASKKAATK